MRLPVLFSSLKALDLVVNALLMVMQVAVSVRDDIEVAHPKAWDLLW